MESVVADRAPDRRQARRRQRVEEHGIVRARVRAGRRVAILNVSAGGALVETAHRLLPGSTVELYIEGDNRQTTVRGRVLRCAVSRVRPVFVSYRGAIVFDGHLPWFVDDESGGYSLHTPEMRSGLHRGTDATREAL